MTRKMYIADTHFGHSNIIRFDNRPFSDLDEMHDVMVTNWNSIVRPNDDVYIAGDFSYKLKPNSLWKLSGRLNGRKHLAWGNHDRRSTDLYSGFVEFGDLLVAQDIVDDTPVRVVISHYYMPFYPGCGHGSCLLHGHTHNGADYEKEEQIKQYLSRVEASGPAYNIGCMYQDYCPQTLEQIIKRSRQRKKEYAEQDIYWKTVRL